MPEVPASPNWRFVWLALTRPIGSGDGVAAQRRNVSRLGGLGDACQARLFQFPVDADGGLVGPSDHGEPAQGARECDQRRHRSILVVHVSAPNACIVAQAGLRRNSAFGTKWRGSLTSSLFLDPEFGPNRPGLD